MKKNVLLEIQRIKKLMSIDSISDFEINENLKLNSIHNENNFLLIENPIITNLDDIMKLGGVALKNEDLLKNIIKEIDAMTPKAEKIALDDLLTDAEKKLSRVEQLEIFAKKLVSQADNIEKDYTAASKNIPEWKLFEDLLSQPSAKKVNSLSARIKALTVQKTNKVFEDTDGIWNKIYENATNETYEWIIEQKSIGKTLPEKEIVEIFNTSLEDGIKKARKSGEIKPHPQRLEANLKTYSEFYDWAFKKFVKSGGKMDDLLDKARLKNMSRETASERYAHKYKTSGSNSKTQKIIPKVDDLTIKKMTLYRNFSFFEKVIRSLINQIRTWFTGYNKILERLQQREIVIKNYDWSKAISQNGVPSDLEGLFRAHLNDMEMLGNYEKNVLGYFDEFVESLELHGIKTDEIKTAFANTEIYKGGFLEVLFGKAKSLADILDDYEKVFGQSKNSEYSKLAGKFVEFKNLIKTVFGDAFQKAKEVSKDVKGKKIGENTLQTLGKVCKKFSPNILSLMTYFSLFSYRSLGRILRLAGPGGVGSIMAIISSFVIADITLVIWKKFLKQFVAIGTYLYEVRFQKDTGGVEKMSYNEKLAQESLAIWAHWFNPMYQTWLQSDVPILAINTYGWVAPMDPINSPMVKLIKEIVIHAGDNSSQTAEKLNQTYNEQLEAVWNKLKKEDQKKIIKGLENSGIGAFSDFKSFGEDPQPGDKKEFYEQNEITEEDFKKIIKSEVGKITVDSSEVKLDVLELIYTLTQEKIKDTDEFTKKQAQKIKEKIQLGAYLVKEDGVPKFYTVERNSTDNWDRKFWFLEIPYTPYYDYVTDKSGTQNEYAIFYRASASSKAEILDKEGLKKLGVNVNNYKFGQKGYLLDKDNAHEIKTYLNEKLPEPPSPKKLTAKQFANLL